jgi:WD40 repeat protein
VSQGQSHGGVYLVDLATNEINQVVDWNTTSIDWEGRGLDRGLRGIAFYGGSTFIAASDEVFVFDTNFNIVKSFKNQYLKHCHEISIAGTSLFLTSTGFDSILVFDLLQESFIRGYCIRSSPVSGLLGMMEFDPERQGGPMPGDTLHINNVIHDGEKITVCGTRLTNILYISEARLRPGPRVPLGTHNTFLYRGLVLANHTDADCIVCIDLQGRLLQSVPVPRYAESQLLMSNIPRDYARQAFGRGLCVTKDGVIIGGSSPTTITVYDLESGTIIKSLNLTMDVRNSVHGLEIWPF